MPRILIADKLEKEAIDDLVSMGAEIDLSPNLDLAGFLAAVRGARVLIVRSREVGKAVIEAGTDLGLIVRAGSGVNTIDVEAASARGIYVANCPGKNSVAVAELAIGLMLGLDRRIPDNVLEIRRGKWAKGDFSKARGIKGRRLGLVGFGSIAREVAKRAFAMEMDVMAYSRSLTLDDADRAGITRATDLSQIFDCDIVSLHVPLNKQTRSLITRDLLGRMSPGSMLINTARAEIVDEEALFDAAKTGRIAVGTDVVSGEPESKAAEFTHRLAGLPNVYITHHIGASTEQAQREVAKAAAAIVLRYLETGIAENAVNVNKNPPIQGTIEVRHLDRIGVLADVLGVLERAEINVETMENVVFTGGVGACARIRVSKRPDESTIRSLGGVEHVLGVELS